MKDSEPLPLPGASGVRLLRAGLLAQTLANRGHQVQWWASQFDHYKKAVVAKAGTLPLSPTYRLELLASSGYPRNISLRRILHNRAVAKQFARRIREEAPPDLILCAMPTIELASEAVRFGREKKIPVLLDLRDMWPEIFVDAVPPFFRPFLKMSIVPLRQRLMRACRDATGILGITPGFVDWGLTLAGRKASPIDTHFWLAHPHARAAAVDWRTTIGFWREHGVELESDFIACFFGSLSNRLDMAPLIEGARRLKDSEPRVRLVICGNGDLLDSFRRQGKGLPNLSFPGYVSGPQRDALLSRASIGLAPFTSRQDYVISVPNKAVEYFSAGLPILSSLQGTLQRLLEAESCGLTYANGDSDAFLEGLLGWYRQPEARKAVSARSAELFEREFVADRVIGRMADHLEAVAART